MVRLLVLYRDIHLDYSLSRETQQGKRHVSLYNFNSLLIWAKFVIFIPISQGNNFCLLKTEAVEPF